MIPENKVKVASVIKRYRDETPLGHQPHMLAHLADEALAILEAEQAIPANCGSGHCSCIECFKEDAKDYQAKCAALDAARYRWLRAASGTTPSNPPTATSNVGRGWVVMYEFYGDRFKPQVTLSNETLDKAINEEMEQLK